jgi:diaminopimelate epimerase
MEFYKYHGAGNDFIMIDNRSGDFDISDKEKIRLMCHRRFGIGADGVFLLESSDTNDFKMVFANNDGSMGSMCGNGGRCIVHFAHEVLHIIPNPKKITFEAIDGIHEAEILRSDSNSGLIKLKMQDVNEITERNGLPFLFSGTTPHNIMYVEDLKNFPVVEEGKKIRNADADPNGVNTNFVELKDGIFNVRTYERGVEDETWACGTGATSVAIASHHLGKLTGNTAHIRMPGGDLTIEFQKSSEGKYQNVWLTGPAVCVANGELTL